MRLRALRLRWPEWLIGAGGVVLLAAMLMLPWYTLTLSSHPPGPIFLVSKQVDGWNGLATSHWLLLLTVIVALAATILQAQRRAPALPVTFAVFAALLGGLSTIWLVVRVLIDPPGGRGIGGWIGLLGAAAISYGGYASVRMEGIARVDAPTEIPTIEVAELPTG
ncbi:MAG TPA: hypothetical protein VMD09_14795 [Solirubrobacteraceae bacterium]|nr:hypothetical protein [Solirubrobacteraceae bacterium]